MVSIKTVLTLVYAPFNQTPVLAEFKGQWSVLKQY